MEQVVVYISEIAFTVGMWGYVIIFLAAFLETALGIGLILPGSTVMLLAGVGATGGGLTLWGLIPAAAAGGVLGDNLNYYLGKKYGRRWVERKLWILTPTHYAKGEDFVNRHGAKSVFFGRFVPAIKEIVPFVAGLLHMDKRRFMLYNVLGAVGWAIEWIGLGYLFGHTISAAESWIVRIQIFAALLLVMFILYYSIRVLTKKSL